MSEGEFVRDLACDQFTYQPCSSEDAALWKTMGQTMGFTDFKPETVNWHMPMYWRGKGDQNDCTEAICTTWPLLPASHEGSKALLDSPYRDAILSNSC